MPMRNVPLTSTLFASVVFGCFAANATMPQLTPAPENRSLLTCREWAARQDDDATEMWGIQEDGTSSLSIALDRLTRSCMGQPAPEIVGFGSSAAFDDAYCAKHPTIKLCRDYKVPINPPSVASGPADEQNTIVSEVPAANDTLQMALNYVFRGDINGKAVSIINQNSCIVEVDGLKYYFRRMKPETGQFRSVVKNIPYGPIRYTAFEIEGDQVIVEVGNDGSKEASIPIVGNVERTKNALMLIFSQYCPSEGPKLPF